MSLTAPDLIPAEVDSSPSPATARTSAPDLIPAEIDDTPQARTPRVRPSSQPVLAAPDLIPAEVDNSPTPSAPAPGIPASLDRYVHPQSPPPPAVPIMGGISATTSTPQDRARANPQSFQEDLRTAVPQMRDMGKGVAANVAEAGRQAATVGEQTQSAAINPANVTVQPNDIPPDQKGLYGPVNTAAKAGHSTPDVAAGLKVGAALARGVQRAGKWVTPTDNSPEQQAKDASFDETMHNMRQTSEAAMPKNPVARAVTEAVASAGPMIASGPFAPVTGAIQGAGEMYDDVYDEMRARGHSPEQAGKVADWAAKGGAVIGGGTGVLFRGNPAAAGGRKALAKGLADTALKMGVLGTATNVAGQTIQHGATGRPISVKEAAVAGVTNAGIGVGWHLAGELFNGLASGGTLADYFSRRWKGETTELGRARVERDARAAAEAARRNVHVRSELDARDALGLDPHRQYAQTELRRAWLKARQSAHPDTPGGSQAAFERVMEAHEWMSGGFGNTPALNRTTEAAAQPQQPQSSGPQSSQARPLDEPQYMKGSTLVWNPQTLPEGTRVVPGETIVNGEQLHTVKLPDGRIGFIPKGTKPPQASTPQPQAAPTNTTPTQAPSPQPTSETPDRYADAVKAVQAHGQQLGAMARGTATVIQRRLKIGYDEARGYFEKMQAAGIIDGDRKILRSNEVHAPDLIPAELDLSPMPTVGETPQIKRSAPAQTTATAPENVLTGPSQQTPAADAVTPDTITKPAGKVKRKPAKAFTKPDILNKITSAYDQQGEVYQDIADEQAIGRFANAYTFMRTNKTKSGFPGEIDSFLEGRPGLKARGVLTLTHDAAQAGGADAMGEMGDKYFEHLDRVNTAKSTRALDWARKGGDPEAEFLAALHDNMPPSKERVKQQVIDPNKLQTNTQFTIHGSKFEIIENEDGYRLLKDGDEYPVVPVEALDKIPVDKGSIKEGEEPELPEGGFADGLDDTSSESDRPLVTPEERSALMGDDEAAKSDLPDGVRAAGGGVDMFGNSAFEARAGGQEAFGFKEADEAARRERARTHSDEIERKPFQRPAGQVVGSDEANDPKNTPKMFPDKGEGEILGKGGGRGSSRTTPAPGASPTPPPAPSEISRQLWGDKSFIGREAIPKAIKVATDLAKIKEGLARLVAPHTRSVESLQVHLAMREMKGLEARAIDNIRAQTAQAAGYFSSRSDAANLEIIKQIEDGAPTTDPVIRQWRMVRTKIYDNLIARVQKVKPGKLQELIANYFPHVWRDPEKAADWLRQLLGKKQMQGSKAFLKQRSIDTTAEGIAAGLEPVTYNPVELDILKMIEMTKFIHAHEFLQEMKARGLAKYVSVNDDAPEGWRAPEDPIFTVYGPPTVALKEYVDLNLHSKMLKVAEALGVKHERQTSAGRGRLGYSVQGGNQIVTQNATELAVLAHELGHQLDHKYGLLAKWGLDKPLKKTVINDEFRKLADLNFEGIDPARVSDYKRSYTRKGVEKIAHLLEGYIHAPDRFKEVAPNLYQEFDSFLASKPELQPLRDIKQSLSSTAIDYEKAHGGLLTMGHYYMPEPAANMVNQHFSPGWANAPAYRAIASLTNTTNQATLALSAFHFVFEGFVDAGNSLAIAAQNLLQGHPVRAAGGAITSLPFVSMLRNVYRGSRVLREWTAPGSIGGETTRIVNHIVAGGARAGQQAYYTNHAAKKMMEAFRNANVVGGVARVPFAVLELANYPLFNVIIPRLKLAAMYDLTRLEVEKLGPNATHDQIRQVAAHVVDVTDDKFGQMVYENLAMNKVAKDILMQLVARPGWQIGTVRAGVGAAKDAATFAGKAATLGVFGRPKVTPEMLFAGGMFVMLAGAGAVLNYFMTGEWPKDARDYFMPRTGRILSDGSAERIMLPSYAKDAMHITKHPLHFVASKLNPAIAMLNDLIVENQDFYGTKIRGKGGQGVVPYLAKQFTPYSIQNQQKMQKQGASARDQVGAFFGINPPPRSLTRTKSEELARQYGDEENPHGARSADDAAKGQAKSEFLEQVRQNPADAKKLVDRAVGKGIIRRDERKNLLEKSEHTYLWGLVKGLSAEHAVEVYSVADEKERAELKPTMLPKILNSKADYNTQDQLIRQAGLEPPPDLSLLREYQTLSGKESDAKAIEKEADVTLRQGRAAYARGDKQQGKDLIEQARQSAKQAQLPREEAMRLDRLREFEKSYRQMQKRVEEGTLNEKAMETRMNFLRGWVNRQAQRSATEPSASLAPIAPPPSFRSQGSPLPRMAEVAA